MNHQLRGLRTYLAEHYAGSIFDQARAPGDSTAFFLHGQRVLTGHVAANAKYDLELQPDDPGANRESVPKHDVKMVCAAENLDAVRKRVKVDAKVRRQGLEPILSIVERNHIKNKTLFPLMIERQVAFFTLLEGEVLRGLVTGFTRYDITVHLKGGVPVTVLRHAVHDLRDKKGRCFLKRVQETRRDWQKSGLWVAVDAEPEAQAS